MKIVGRTMPRPLRSISPFGLGLAFVIVALVAGVLLFNKNAISTAFRSGERITINFAANRGLVPDLSQVKVSWVPVGVVSDVERRDDGSVLVSVKVDDGTRDKLGSEPSAVIRPTMLLGGNYFVDLVPGGDRGPGEFSGKIPLGRTKQPVELDDVARALQPNVLEGLQGTVRQFDKTLAADGRAAIDELVRSAPSALRPADEVLTAAQGTHPRTDLTNLVSGLESTARVLTAQEGQMDAIVTGLKKTTGTLDARSGDLSTAISTMPSALASTETGLARLDKTLAKLRAIAKPARPIATELATTLRHLNPALVKSRPVVRNLTALMADARPMVKQLDPLVVTGTDVLGDVHGAPLKRLNGPVKKFVLSPFVGRGEFTTAHSKKPLYKEAAYMFAGLDRATMLTDRNGSAPNLQPGIGKRTLATDDLARMFEYLTDRYLSREGEGQ